MNRTFLRWFYISVQFIMLAVSIPKVATLFHAYDPEIIGPLVAGIDLRSWLVGVAIDLTATLTTWAALARFDESRQRLTLLAPAIIILFCTGLSVVANYEDAATLHPEQYAGVSVFAHPALLVNPLLISAPPILVLLLILLVPSVLAQPRIKTPAEIEAEVAEQEARIAAEARIRVKRAEANALVMGARVKGLFETVGAVATRAGEQDESEALPMVVEADPPPDDDPQPPVPTANMTRAMWQAMKLSERVVKSGIITPQEVAEVLGISLTHARNLTRGVESGTQRIDGRSGVSYNDLIDALYDQRTKNTYGWARKLETTLGMRKRNRTLQVVPNDPNDPNDELEEEAVSEGSGE